MDKITEENMNFNEEFPRERFVTNHSGESPSEKPGRNSGKKEIITAPKPQDKKIGERIKERG